MDCAFIMFVAPRDGLPHSVKWSRLSETSTQMSQRLISAAPKLLLDKRNLGRMSE
jgi:hypothetical protein